MTRDDFVRWRDDPVTRQVIAAHRVTAEDNRSAWMTQSWDNGHSNPLNLLELRSRADAYMAIAEMTYEGLCETMGVEPNNE